MHVKKLGTLHLSGCFTASSLERAQYFLSRFLFFLKGKIETLKKKKKRKPAIAYLRMPWVNGGL